MKAKEYLKDIERVDVEYVDRLNKVRLDRNEKVSSWTEEIWKKMQEVISPDVIMSYPELEPLYQRLSSLLMVKRDQLLLSHGSDVGIKTIFEVYAEKEDEAVSLKPSYAMYPVYAQMVGAKPVEIGFLEDLSLPFEHVLDAISNKTKIVCLANPNQPIERVFKEEEIESLIDISDKKDFIVVVDEAYHYFCPETVLPKIGRHPNLIVTRSFSKAFGFAGLRAGLLISNEEVIANLRKVKPISEINNVAAKLIELFLGNMDVVSSHVKDINLGREVVMKRAGKLGIRIHGKMTNSILLELESAEIVKSLVTKARAEGYLLKGPFSYPATRHLRITLGTPDIMNRVMDIIERGLR